MKILCMAGSGYNHLVNDGNFERKASSSQYRPGKPVNKNSQRNKMKLLVFYLLLIPGIFCSCRKTNTIPECLQSKIDHFKNTSCEHGASVKKYRFQGKIVYVFSMGFCGADMAASVVDNDCNYLGLLGGIDGNTEIGGVGFSTAVYVMTVWSR